MVPDPISVAKACLHAYVAKDRAALEALIGADFVFTSPLDNALGRDRYFAICWPNSALMAEVRFICEAQNGERAFLVYEATTTTGKRFRNCEAYLVRDGQLRAVEVYFGWNVPHEVPCGQHAPAPKG